MGKTYGRSNTWIRLLWEEIGLRCYMEQNEPCLLGLSFHEKAQVTGAAYAGALTLFSTHVIYEMQ